MVLKCSAILKRQHELSTSVAFLLDVDQSVLTIGHNDAPLVSYDFDVADHGDAKLLAEYTNFVDWLVNPASRTGAARQVR